MSRCSIAILSLLMLATGTASAQTPTQTNCPAGTYRMITPNGVICVPYGQGSPTKPGPPQNKSSISGRSAPGSGNTGSGKVQSAQ